MIEELKKHDLDLEPEEDVAGFLGVLINQKEDGMIELTQQGLINRILKALNVESLPTKETPAAY